VFFLSWGKTEKSVVKNERRIPANCSVIKLFVMQNQIFIRLILALFFTAGCLVKSYSQPPCALPPPENLTVTAITPTSISLAWTLSPVSPTYVVVYKISCFDETDQVALPDEYTTLLTHTRSGLQPGHYYRIGVSASQCNNEFGEEIVAKARTSTIIIDYIVQNSCSPTNNVFRQMGDTTEIILIPGISETEPVQVVRSRVRKSSYWMVEYTIWADCNGTPHYRAIQEFNVTRTPPPDNEPVETLSIEFDDQLTTGGLFNIDNVSSGIGSGGQLVTKVVITYETPCTSGFCSGLLGNYNCPPPPSEEENNGPGFGRNAPGRNAGEYGLNASHHEDIGLSVTPNPASDAISVEYTLPSEGPAVFSLFDVSGQKIKTFDAPGVLQPGLYNTVFQLNELPAGMYFLALQTATERRIISLVKQ
jgi:hypothetical protein